MNVQVVYASRHGGTAGIAKRIAETLRSHGLEAALADAADRPDIRGYDAHIVGSGVYMGAWVKEGLEFLERNEATLASRPVWLFSSGPLPIPTKGPAPTDPIEMALGPKDGPGSGGRKKVEALEAVIHPRGHGVFKGVYDPTQPPKSLPERFLRLTPASSKILPAGDFRDWDVIEAWAHEIAAEMTALVPIG